MLLATCSGTRVRSGAIRLLVPDANRNEREYVLRYVFETRLGLHCVLEHGSDGEVLVEAPDSNRRLRIPDVLLRGPDLGYLNHERLPAVRARRLSMGALSGTAAAGESDIVAAYDRPDVNVAAERCDAGIALTFDALGLIFFMLSRLEEVVLPERDEHERFPTGAAWLVRNGLELRPIVDETIALIRRCCDDLWPGVTSEVSAYRCVPSHDIDHPFLYHGLSTSEGLRRLVRKAAGHLLLRRDLVEAASSAYGYLQYIVAGPRKDPYLTLPELMDRSEARGLRSIFYLIVRPRLPIDGRAYLEEETIAQTVRTIAERGHGIGLHASYSTLSSPPLAAEEAGIFRAFLERVGLPTDSLAVRHHYLRWDARSHWAMWSDLGFAYDATLGYGDAVGFRCGTSHEFPAFDLTTRRELPIRERPLLVMDTAVCPDAGLSPPARRGALETLAAIVHGCRAHGGTMELLWHNTHLQSHFQRAMYDEVLDVCSSPIQAH